MLNDAEDMRKDDRHTSDNPLSAIGGLMSDAFSDIERTGKSGLKRKWPSFLIFLSQQLKMIYWNFYHWHLAQPAKKGAVEDFGFTKDQPENKLHNQVCSCLGKGKCEQIIMKAKFSMKEDKKVLEEIMNYAKELGIK